MRGEGPRCVVFYASRDEANIQCFQNHLQKVYPTIKVIAVSDGTDAVKYFSTGEDQHEVPCLIIMDVVMPSKTGIEALEEIRRHPIHCYTPAVLISKAPFHYEHVVEEKLKAKLVIRPNCDQKKKELIKDVFTSFCPGIC
ncbi:response regulator [Cnuella takakiae]|uniref:response regulator n=1 Tax=Cnuella takakiae TaxID=1302690 RepID=UPI0009340EF4|nr:response regulator [Cnuella takakiae]OLY92484.1 hypothetical protein BUE76_11745 [Cnuella takakiae]